MMGPLVVGREKELALVASFLAAEDRAPALVLTGAPGIGKTTVWEAAVETARMDGWCVLRARAAESEAQLSFVGLDDLLQEVEIGSLRGVPAPQRRALDVVLFRAEPVDATPEPSAAAVGLANAFRVLAGDQRLLVAVDDVPWLDRSSADALAYAARRLRDGRICFLFARRPGEPSRLERAFEPRSLQQLEVGALSLGAMRVLLAQRLGLELPRRLLRRLFEAAEGNPLLALELAEPLKGRVVDAAAAGITSVSVSGEPFAERVAALGPPLRRALLGLALSPDLTRAELDAFAGRDVVEEALAFRLLVDGGEERVRVAHPLLAAAVSRSSEAGERRQLHLEIARTVVGETRAIRHAALGTAKHDAELAARACAAAAAALARGAVYDAVELGQQALRLTVLDDSRYTERLLELAQYLVIVGELPAVTELLAARVESLPAGRAQAQAHLLLGEAAALADHERHLEQALALGADEPDLRAAALAARSTLLALNRVTDLAKAEVLAEQAVEAAAAAGEESLQRALHALAWARALRGRPLDDFRGAEDPARLPLSLYESAVARPEAVRRVWRGELEDARRTLRRLLAQAEQRGEARSCVVLQLHLCELELRVGDARAAAAILGDWDAWTASEAADDIKTIRARCEALLAALRARADEVAHWAKATASAIEEGGFAWDQLETLRARGLAAIHAHAPQQAAEALRAVWDHARRHQIDEPGAFPVGPDLVEVLYELGQVDQARVISERLACAAIEQRHPWALAATKRCEAAARLFEGHGEEALELLEAAAEAYRDLGLRFDSARALLTAGRAARGLRRWGVARRLLEDAAGIFRELGCDGWAEQADAQLDRIGARKPVAAGDLTSAERRVAALAAAGLSNKEIAGRLVISVSTVETHLKHCYAKLAISSRTQLAARIDPAERSAAS